MKKFKKSIAVLTAGMITTLLFTGCKDSEKDSSDDFSVSESQTEIITENDVTTAPAELATAETTTVTTVPPHVSPVETVSY